MDISYQERQDRLANRIRAHALFANIDISDWLDAHLARRRPHDVLDVGCGDGHHLDLYLRHVGTIGTVTAIDRDAALIARAEARHPEAGNLTLRVASMDDPLPFPDRAFDLCVASFSIYNARDGAYTVGELHRVLADGGELVLIGPTPHNARELAEFAAKVTGRQVGERTRLRTERLMREFLPLTLNVFGRVHAEVINSFLAFPDRDEFLRYFCSTLLYEEMCGNAEYSRDDLAAFCPETGEITVSKEMVAVVATKAA